MALQTPTQHKSNCKFCYYLESDCFRFSKKKKQKLAPSWRLDTSMSTSRPAGSFVTLRKQKPTGTFPAVAKWRHWTCVHVCVPKIRQEGREKPFVLYFALILLRKCSRDLTKNITIVNKPPAASCLCLNQILALAPPLCQKGDANWPDLISTDKEKKKQKQKI